MPKEKRVREPAAVMLSVNGDTTLRASKRSKTQKTSTGYDKCQLTCLEVETAIRAMTRSIPDTIDMDTIFRDARTVNLTSDGSSWIYYVPAWYRRVYAHCLAHGQLSVPYKDWFRQLWELHPATPGTIKMFGRDVLTPRFQQAYGATHRFSGATFHGQPFPDLLHHAVGLLRICVTATGNDPHLIAGLLNWYAHGAQYIGPHSDDRANVVRGAPIVSLSLGASRRFVFTPTSSAAADAKRVEIMLHDGDLLVMGGRTQQTHKHALPKMKGCLSPRVSLTLRCLVTPSNAP